MWTQEDIRVASVLEAGLGQVRVVEVIKHEENSMTDIVDTNAPEDTDWSDAEGGASYPQYPTNPHNHRFTISVDGRGPMIVVRGNTAQEVREGFEELTAGGAAAAAQSAFQAFKGAQQAPAQGMPAAMQSQPNYNPQMPPANQPYAGQPAWQQAGAPQAQAAPAWGGGQPQAQQGQRKEYPAPAGWYKLNVPFPGGKDVLHALATQLQIPKGNPNKGGVYNFFGLSPSGVPGKAWYCAPEAAQAFAQFTPMPA